MPEISKFISPQGRLPMNAEQRTRPAQELIDSIEHTDDQSIPGPLVNRIEGQEVKRRLLTDDGADMPST